MKEPSAYFKKSFGINALSKTDEKYIFTKNNFRFSILTSRLLRVEFDKERKFTDEPTQAVLCRNFDAPEFKIIENNSIIKIGTRDTVFTYDIAKKKMLSVTLKNGETVTDFKKGNLKGTYRTLDMVNGSIPLGDGLISRNGVAVIDDSKSVLLAENGTIKERRACRDEYFLAYGHDYRGCLSDFFKLSGEVPLVPRYCLGNWWSRYKDYSQQEYVDLMRNFIRRQIPITVATIDMDWHWVNIDERFGKENTAFEKHGLPLDNFLELFQSKGWTGYSWNTDLFPDYKGMLRWLQENGFKVTLNLHPAQGVRPFEDMYAEMAEKMGIDPETKKPIPFDITDPNFIDAYFNVLHKPYENEGVDFWWIDWQQEKTTKIKGLDPLWALNHYHTLAMNGDNKRPLILSRFANVGSHRYPLGFSGDTIITWKSLDFQPYFTITAANVGYTWWSHDIGGHQLGSRNDELYARWVQFGEYSPIMRLHSTKDEFMGKEPWKYDFAASSAAINAMRERHAMIPYIYSMNHRTNADGIALCEPVYYSYPDEKSAYEIKNEYFFGSELLVVPVTSPMSKTTNLAATNVWLPKGRWTDIYNGRIYEGGKTITMYRGIESLPVLAKEGAIIPLSANDRNNDCKNPQSMKLRIYRGTSEFELYEDDGESMKFKDGESAITKFKIKECGRDVYFTICKAEGDLNIIPEKRDYELIFEDIVKAESIIVKANGRKKNVDIRNDNDKTVITLSTVAPKSEIQIEFKSITARKNRSKKEQVIDLLSSYQLSTAFKKLFLASYIKDLSKPFPIKKKELSGPIEEIEYCSEL
ncbi:MAG: DUF5110 domain-containing protein [Faecalibacterium sp.]|nr:DUF5110 domain-containing protein [Ruminococcus sp.]MCM1392688.1 DUF5110 domain-containing protein [Ruminococcus sp.]MCM1484819.1 DUF5110 domain-containing protein [Faecalibacterium sp.]